MGEARHSTQSPQLCVFRRPRPLCSPPRAKPHADIPHPDAQELNQLKDIPFGELLRLSRDGRENGAKAGLGPGGADGKRLRLSAAIKAVRRAQQEVRVQRANKNRPVEVSSKAPVPKLREVVPGACGERKRYLHHGSLSISLSAALALSLLAITSFNLRAACVFCTL